MTQYSWQQDSRVDSGNVVITPPYSPKELKHTSREKAKQREKADQGLRDYINRIAWGSMIVGAVGLIVPVFESIGNTFPILLIALGMLVLIYTALSEGEANLAKKQATWKQTEVKVWGFPGDGLKGAEEKFGKRNVYLGNQGEKLTGKLLEPLLEIPSVRIFHGMQFPGSYNADVDHLIISGNKVALIDSKFWKPAEVRWTMDGNVERVIDGEVDSEFNISMHTALNRYWNIVEAESRKQKNYTPIHARGYIVVHPSTKRGQVVLDDREIRGIKMSSPEAAVEELGKWFLEDEELTVNRRLLRSILSYRAGDSSRFARAKKQSSKR